MADTEQTEGLRSGRAVFLVKDPELGSGNPDAPFFCWLRQEGFRSWGKHGCYTGVDWVFVNVNSRIFAPGMPGIPLAEPVGGHAVTKEEFLTIYRILKKYEGLSVLEMPLVQQT